ncbi:DsbE family thiol:disulfide interchange protein [Grimontia hollisae]|uniref:Cytochrome c-type biogenesis protein CcmG/DsbE thiol:disulfide oxidoreductase n=2 Tax=Grimontia hollisae TaxID=673 RepID=D0IC67_GRIHO|nr:DsbE family thiol:disulfide interchange protein [Grimontia hollisae]AMG29860.1 DsbE family thiol:disulfide interchange protein [Grimontia hollisae]EEY71485.1 cytochrome c-type biogenesis protein CcmG/DsbE thiol:disulfide oxidoreductase [Grimontia hollisae CIP 101886]MDF2185524.1 DsbE family thiol:disulfide interchange protein [Grimontia hollisae]STO43181.1 Cytochrome c biogenesis protein CcmG [Grimontia hollisae]STO56839.1 Cytochrome c biogenesis protein CcmG [Grimontia hollisae]
MKKPLLFIPFALFMLLVAVFFVQLGKNAEGDDPTKLESVLVGKPVPAFRLEDLAEAGKLYDQDIFHGEPLLLNVWATWCPTCYAEHTYLNKLAAEGVKIIGLNYKDDRVKAIGWLNSLGNPYLVSLFDGDGLLGLDLGVYGAPETFLIDADGIIRYRHVGDVNERNWNDTLRPMYEALVAEAKG